MRNVSCLKLSLGLPLFLGSLVLPASLGLTDDGPSFDCTKALQPDENAICADPRLSTLDSLIADAYTTFEPAFDDGDKKQIARTLAADRHACGADPVCIASVQSNALDTFGFAPAWVESYVEGLIGWKALRYGKRYPANVDQPMPGRIAECAITHIKELTTRLGDDPFESAPPEAGSTVQYANGGVGVSYDREIGLTNANVGDRVAVCLMSIPRDCPKGDERGRVFYGVDLRSGATWALPDSQHMCGGA